MTNRKINCDVTSSYNKSSVWKGGEFACGWGAAVINVSVTFPINKVMFRQQQYGIRFTSAVTQIHKEGLLHLYRGLLPPLLQKTTSMSLMFGMYDIYQQLIYGYQPNCPVVLSKATAAMLSGCTEAIFCPFERVQTLMQNKFYHDHYRNTYHAFQELRSYGLKEYYRGLTPILFRNGSSNALFFLLREPIKNVFQDLFPHSRESAVSEMAANFVSGAILGACISTIFYPLNVIKVRMQEHVGGKYDGVKDTFVTVFNKRNRSWTKMFRGVHVNFTRSLISWGIINASYELLKSYWYAEKHY